MLLMAALARPSLDVWYGPNPFQHTTSLRSGHSRDLRARPDFYPNVLQPAMSWPDLAKRTGVFKIFLDMLYTGISTDAQLIGLIGVVQQQGLRTGIEVGGARWGAGRCNLTTALAYATIEQRDVARWLSLGGRIDSLSTDHADVWNVRGGSGPLCEPPIPMADRIEVVAQVFASWRRFLGAEASLGFIESLGFWDIEGPDGKSYKNTEPAVFSKIDGWIPRLEDVTSRLLDAAKRHNPVPGTPLLDHYLIDYGLEGVEYDTHTYGPSPTGGLNYGRVLGAEAIMHRHGLRTGVMMNAFADRSLNCSAAFARCSASAALRTLEYTQGYMRLPSRLSEHAVLEQWQPHPNTTGPASLPYSGMWMASAGAAAVSCEAFACDLSETRSAS